MTSAAFMPAWAYRRYGAASESMTSSVDMSGVQEMISMHFPDASCLMLLTIVATMMTVFKMIMLSLLRSFLQPWQPCRQRIHGHQWCIVNASLAMLLTEQPGTIVIGRGNDSCSERLYSE